MKRKYNPAAQRRYYLKHGNAIRARAKKYHYAHIDRIHELQKGYRANYSAKTKRNLAIARERWHARVTYGLSREKWLALRKLKCQICNKKHRIMCVDHKIKGTYRGVLCILCNSKLGWYEKWQNQIHTYLK